MKYFTYFLGFCATVFAVSFYFNWFWDVFFAVYYQEVEVLVYGFNPKGLPPFNWKINILIWLSGIALIAVLLGLIMDGVCKSHYRKRDGLPLIAVILNQTAALIFYVAAGVFSGYAKRFYYIPRFLLGIINDIFFQGVDKWNEDIALFWICLFHGVIMSAICMVFYMGERRRQLYIVRREAEYRKDHLKTA